MKKYQLKVATWRLLVSLVSSKALERWRRKPGLVGGYRVSKNGKDSSDEKFAMNA